MAELTQRELDEFRDYADRVEERSAWYAIRRLLTEVERLQNLVVLLRAEKDAANSLLLDVQQDCVHLRQCERIMREALEHMAAEDVLCQLEELEG